MHWYGAAADCDADDRKLWRAVNPASFVTTEALRKQRNSPSMSRSHLRPPAPERLGCPRRGALDRERQLGAARRRVEIADGATVFVGADGSRSLRHDRDRLGGQGTRRAHRRRRESVQRQGRRPAPRLPRRRNDRLRRRGGVPARARLPLRRARGSLRSPLPRALDGGSRRAPVELGRGAGRAVHERAPAGARRARTRRARGHAPPPGRSRRSRSRCSRPPATASTTATCAGSGSSTARGRSTRRWRLRLRFRARRSSSPGRCTTSAGSSRSKITGRSGAPLVEAGVVPAPVAAS